ncbi:hypothetical protein HXX76_000669 [Chlamydomonas incerta]|uniref:Uncharacterized protein n=1 Tax=Chlamydomonas incerta TaxID=51695 RepID=A0A835WEP4_CHLIN|nr:hypothetical protein HXX76_000669 [Chlamydomonas incerta]|eukprot:KAG2446067.1 hypothetical protein HXX76_000669 [Chlamydomonas incerta]
MLTSTGGSAGSGKFAAGMKAAKKDTSDPREVQRARGEASAAARGHTGTVQRHMPDIHNWFKKNWPNEKTPGKWKAVVGGGGNRTRARVGMSR